MSWPEFATEIVYNDNKKNGKIDFLFGVSIYFWTTKTEHLKTAF